jgi:putative (di)nucleoside polyphosphate hydrolase
LEEKWQSCKYVLNHFNDRDAGACKSRYISVIDVDGFRPNVGIMLANSKGQVFWARRIGQDAWQFPQGGIQKNESPEQALYRELHEEVGLEPGHVRVIACTRGWLRYRLPQRLVRRDSKPVCVGQKQKWFLLQMLADDSQVQVSNTSSPEFDGWQWVSYWYPLGQVVSFKREVYRRAMKELAPRHSRLVNNS